MDITLLSESSLDSNWITITDPRSGVNTDIRIRVNSPDSKEYQKLVHKLSNDRLKQMSKRGSITSEQVEQENIELLASNTLEWEGLTSGGQAIPFSHQAAVDLYTRFKWLREQVDAFLGDRKNFFKD